MTFADRLHAAIEQNASDLDAPEKDCVNCGRAYDEHSTQLRLRSDKDPATTWYTEYGERCPTRPSDYTALYLSPENL